MSLPSGQSSHYFTSLLQPSFLCHKDLQYFKEVGSIVQLLRPITQDHLHHNQFGNSQASNLLGNV